MCARTAALPPVLDEDAAEDLEPGAPLPLKDADPGYVALGSSGYVDDTQAVALVAASLQGTVPATEEWLQVTGQDVRVDKSCSRVQGEPGAPAVLLQGVPIPVAATFRQLGVDVAIGGSRTTGPVLSRRLEAGRSALRRLPHLSTYDRRERAISTLVTPRALHGVAVASVREPDLRGLETAVVRALWGATRVSRAKEVIFTVLSKGHRVSPVMHTRYERLLWLVCVARWPAPRSSPTLSGNRVAALPGGARAPHDSHPWLEPARGLVVLGRPGARAPAAYCAGAPMPAPTPGPGQPSLPFLASA